MAQRVTDQEALAICEAMASDGRSETQTRTNFLPTSMPAHLASTPLHNGFDHLLLHADRQPAAKEAYCSTGSEEAPVRCT